ncbi:hypothetical protein IPG36_08275 [bacterium]|nr:MAG: hypothetical protein IPG36_08275 [bacterium]
MCHGKPMMVDASLPIVLRADGRFRPVKPVPVDQEIDLIQAASLIGDRCTLGLG